MIVILKKILKVYHIFISPWFGTRCRFAPTCSDYASQALDKHGLVKGSVLATKRLCRCHPFGGYGYDPVPDIKPAPTDNAIHSEYSTD